MMARQVQQAPIVERPSFTGRRHQIPAMHIADVEVPCDVELGERAGQLRVGEYISVDAQVAAVKQTRELGNRGAAQVHPHAELVLAVRAGLYQTTRGEFAEALRGLIGTGWRARKANYHFAIFVGINIHVGVADIKDGLGVAEFEIDAPAADLNVGYAAAMRAPRLLRRTIEQRLNIPRPR